MVAAAIIRERSVPAAASSVTARSACGSTHHDSSVTNREIARFTALQHLAGKCGLDPAEHPFLVSPTLHYQNGGVVIDEHGRTDVDGLYCAGELAGGIHGRNRLMGNALLTS